MALETPLMMVFLSFPFLPPWHFQYLLCRAVSIAWRSRNVQKPHFSHFAVPGLALIKFFSISSFQPFDEPFTADTQFYLTASHMHRPSRTVIAATRVKSVAHRLLVRKTVDACAIVPLSLSHASSRSRVKATRQAPLLRGRFFLFGFFKSGS